MPEQNTSVLCSYVVNAGFAGIIRHITVHSDGKVSDYRGGPPKQLSASSLTGLREAIEKSGFLQWNEGPPPAKYFDAGSWSLTYENKKVERGGQPDQEALALMKAIDEITAA